MKKINYYLLLVALVAAFSLTACRDFLDTNPDTITNEKDYIAKEDEMYKGFMAILTRMQKAGDQAIFLTDTRANFFEITDNAPVELQNIYNYDSTDGNSYADPTCYYAIVLACNDFFAKMEEYKEKVGKNMSDKAAVNFNALISSAIRIKVWAYYTIGRIYGKAVWYDNAMGQLEDLKNDSVFTRLDNMEQVVDKCLDLLDNGLTIAGEDIPSNLEMDWGSWIDEEHKDNAAYGYWNYLVPQYLIMRCELISWKCNYRTEADSRADWQWIRDTIAGYLNYMYTTAPTTLAYKDRLYQCCIPLSQSYYTIFYSEQVGNSYQLISGIMYDYENDQTNRLVQYFCPSYPGDGFYLRPSQWGIDLYDEADIRGLVQEMSLNTINGQVAFCKYYNFRGEFLRTDIFKIMPTIILYRGHDFQFLLAEAENHLGNWLQSYTLLNMGLENQFSDGRVNGVPDDWNQGYNSWFGASGGYGNNGIVGCARGKIHDLPRPTDDEYTITEEERIKMYDLALADEYTLEFVGEGKVYSYLVKMAERYGKNPTILENSILPKYPVEKQAKVRSSLEQNYWFDWDLKLDD